MAVCSEAVGLILPFFAHGGASIARCLCCSTLFCPWRGVVSRKNRSGQKRVEWRWRESNPRPGNLGLGFLHV